MRGGPLTIQLAILKGSWKNNAKWTGFLKGLKASTFPCTEARAPCSG